MIPSYYLFEKTQNVGKNWRRKREKFGGWFFRADRAKPCGRFFNAQKVSCCEVHRTPLSAEATCRSAPWARMEAWLPLEPVRRHRLGISVPISYYCSRAFCVKEGWCGKVKLRFAGRPKCARVHLLLSVQVMSVLVCSFVLIAKPDCWYVWSRHRSQHPSYSRPWVHACIIRCSSCSFSHHRSQHSVEHPLSHCVSRSSYPRDSISSVWVPRIRWYDVLCVRPWNWVQTTSYWSWGRITMKETCSCPLHVRNSSQVVYRSNSCYPVLRNQMTCTSHTSCEQCYPCHSVVRWVNQRPVLITTCYWMYSWAHCSRNRIWCAWTYPEWKTRWRMVSPPFSQVCSIWYLSNSRNTWWFLQSCHTLASEWLPRVHSMLWQTSLSFVSTLSPRICHSRIFQ